MPVVTYAIYLVTQKKKKKKKKKKNIIICRLWYNISQLSYLTPKNGGTAGQAPDRRLGLSERMRHQFCPLWPVIVNIVIPGSAPVSTHPASDVSRFGHRSRSRTTQCTPQPWPQASPACCIINSGFSIPCFRSVAQHN